MDRLLLQIELYHQYYNDSLMQNVTLKPDSAAQQFIDHYGLVIHQSIGQFELYYFGPANVLDFYTELDEILQQQPLVFLLNAEPGKFTVISHMPLDSLGQINYSSTRVEKIDNHRVQLLPLFSTNNNISNNIVGQISIYSQDLFSHEGKRINCYFAVYMAARQTQWAYFVVNRNHLRLQELQIKNSEGIKFDSPVEVKLPSGHSALLFSSGDRHFAMSQTPMQVFDLVSYINPPDVANSEPALIRKTLIKGLPVPNLEQLHIKSTNGKQYACSEMYVYL